MKAYRQRQRAKQMTKISSDREIPQDDFDTKDSEHSYVRPISNTDSAMKSECLKTSYCFFLFLIISLQTKNFGYPLRKK